eukprot:gb/GECG01015385.1/.p1 GENE.gb/GECG01015385.1/~~gb/GECG01015385.1/.p1  ORF type:complete len:499 (+),score=51.85 gb/GECG01015385.1/:1-1497(+)
MCTRGFINVYMQDTTPRGSSIKVYTEAVAGGTTDKHRILEQVLGDISRVSELNAFITVLSAEQALRLNSTYEQEQGTGEETAEKPLRGVPFCIEDCFDLPGVKTTAGTPALADNLVGEDQQPLECIQRLLRAGAIPVGKNNMHELGFGTSGINPHTGATKNPHNTAFIAGGAASGTGAIVGAGVTPFGIGNDDAGSSQISAVFCGCHSFRPSTRRYTDNAASDCVLQLCSTRDAPVPMARTVSDLSLLDSILAGESHPTRVDPLPPAECKIGVPNRFFWDNLDDGVKFLCTRLLGRLRNRGVAIQPIDFPEELISLNKDLSSKMLLHEASNDITNYLQHHQMHKPRNLQEVTGQAKSPNIHEALFVDSPHSESACKELVNTKRSRLQQLLKEVMEFHGVKAIVMPTTPVPPSTIREGEFVTLDDTQHPMFATHIRNTEFSANAGLPSLSMSIGKTRSHNVPVGISVDGIPGSDRDLLGMGCLLEKIIPEVELPNINEL